jgi:hypothetical protein
LYFDELTEIGQQRDATQKATPDTGGHQTPAFGGAGVTAPPAGNLSERPPGQAYYDREDLKAQREMAKWTERMGQAAIAGVFLSLIGIYLIWGTFRETKQMVAVSRRTVSAIITVKASKITPFENKVLLHFGGGNLGPTKAFDVCISGNIKILGNCFPFERMVGVVVETGFSRNAKILEFPSLTQIVNDATQGVIELRCSYKTIFGEKLTTDLQRYEFGRHDDGDRRADGTFERVNGIFLREIDTANDDDRHQQRR